MRRRAALPVVLLACSGVLGVPFAPTARAQDPLWKKDGDPLGSLGWSVAALGDLDGDGSVDIVAGDPDDDTAGNSTGRVRVYSGRDGAVLWKADGANDGDHLGIAAAAAGDVDGDGVPDVIAGTTVGVVRVISGADESNLLTFSMIPIARFGRSVAGIGDVDQDGHDDVAIGQWASDQRAPNGGACYVFSGADGHELFSFFGARDADRLGWSVAAAGDADADGVPDFLIGAPTNTGRGFVQVRSGKDGSLMHRVQGVANLGYSVCGAGDVDQDGHDDFAATDPGVNKFGAASGSATVFSGKDGSVLFEVFGERQLASYGEWISGGRDLNRDGWPDFAVGAATDDESHPFDVGSVRLYSGRTGTRLYSFFGSTQDGRFGACVALAGDMDGDGIDDLAVGAYHDDDPTDAVGNVDAYAGNDLFAQPRNELVAGGVPLELDLTGGPPGSPCAVFLMEFDGLHNVQMLALDVLDGVGSFYYRADVPPGFGSHDVVLQGFYCGDPSRGRGVADSTRVAIRLR